MTVVTWLLQRIAALLFVTASIPLAAQSTPSEQGWPAYGGTLAGQRYSTAKQIDTQNVSALSPVWVFHTHALDNFSKVNWRSSFEATPVLWGDTLYFDTAFDQVFAIDATTGQEKWTFDPHIDRSGEINIAASRGVALWHATNPQAGSCNSDRVIVATLDRRLIARDAATGAPCLGFGTEGTVDLAKSVSIADTGLYSFTSPPTVVGDTVVLGSSIADNQAVFVASGAVRGFDAVTGKQKWTWEPVRWTTPQNPTSGSGNAWSVISADPEHDLVFVPTGSPSVDFYGGTRIGDNRDADSIIALQASTGRRVWGFQLVHHDLWDYDTPSEPVLFTFRGKIPAVAVTTKTNMVYVFNRLTGKPLYPIVERPVPPSHLPGEVAWPTQPYSTLPPLAPLSIHASDLHLKNPADQKFCTDQLNHLENYGLFTPPSHTGSVLYPGSLGGANWGSSAFDPVTGTLYTRVSVLPYLVRESDAGPRGSSLLKQMEEIIYLNSPEWAGGAVTPLRKTMGTPDTGAEERDESPQVGTPYRMARQAIMTAQGVPCAPAPFGSIVALNLNTGVKEWSVAHGEMVPGEPGSIGVGGIIVTAGNLVFGSSTVDPFLSAYDARNGRLLWRGRLPSSSQATPMTYTAKGRQYVVVAAGGHASIGSDKSDAVVAFALPATPGVTNTQAHYK